MRRNRGFTLMEILIAMALAAIVTTSVLALVRTQLSTFEMNDQIMRTQQSARAAMDFLETNVRRACGGISNGEVAVNVGSVQQRVPCLRFTDGASIGTTSFTSSGPTTLPDALEVVYATGTMTATTAIPTLSGSPVTLAVADISKFSANDFVLLTGTDFVSGYLFQVSSVSPATGTTPTPGTLTLASFSGTLVTPTNAPVLKIGMPVFKAATYSFFVVPASASSTYSNMLMVDTNGVASTSHSSYNNSSTVQPLVEGVVDFQVAIGNDTNPNDGVITESTASPASDEWIGNSSSDTGLSAPPWTGATQKPRQVRLSLLLQTLNRYGGQNPLSSLTQFEDRPTSSYPTFTGAYPRYRSAQIVVAPRAWNLSE